nr:chromate transporter [Hyphomicrobium sp.]
AYVIAALAFAAIFLLRVPFPIIVLAAGIFGYLRNTATDQNHRHAAAPPVSTSQTLQTIALWLAIWILPLAAVAISFGTDHVLSKLALFFSTLAIVTFGGAYAVLAYMAQEAVQSHGWLSAADMLNGLGLAETTPGPLILVTEFVGYLAAYRSNGGANSIAMGILGAIVTLWATFAPCFLYIFAGAPYIERLKNAPRLHSALSAITAAVVGVILNLSVWFALHVLFRNVVEVAAGPLHVTVPELASIDVVAVTIAVVAALLLFRFHAGIMSTLAACAALGLAASLVL